MTDSIPASAEGQVATAPTGTTETTPTAPTGQVESPTTTQEPESFFDPNGLAPDLQPAYKQMQGAFTKKMQEAARIRKEAEALTGMQREYQADPYGFVTRLAQQHGWSVQQAAQVASGNDPKPWQPNTWEEVIDRTKSVTRAEVLKELSPVIEQVRSAQAQRVEEQLDAIDPTWRTYEDRMSELAGMMKPEFWKRPDAVSTLYEMVLPPNVRESRATQKALAKLKTAERAAAPQGVSQKPKSVSAPPKGGMTFGAAVEMARKTLTGG